MPKRVDRFDAELVREQWDHAADAYDHAQRTGLDRHRFEFFGPTQVVFTGDVKGLKLLDIGCGTGYFSRHMAERGAEVTGVDISENQLGYALKYETETPLGIDYRAMDAVEIAKVYAEESFDLVTGCMSLMDMPEPGEVIKAAAKVLRPGGRLVFSILHPCFLTPFREWHRDADGNKRALMVSDYFDSGPIETTWQSDTMLYEITDTWMHATLTEWVGWITNAGFKIWAIDEPQPTEKTIHANPELADGRLVPNFLFIDARKQQVTAV